MESYEPNDFVYIDPVGFCRLINCGRYKGFKLERKEDGSMPTIYPVVEKKKEATEPPTIVAPGHEVEDWVAPMSGYMLPSPKNSVDMSGSIDNVEKVVQAENPPVENPPAEAVASPPANPPNPPEAPKEYYKKEYYQLYIISSYPNIVTAMINATNVLVYTPDYTLRKTINLKVKTFFGQRLEFDVPISIYSSFTQLRAKVIEVSKETASLYNTRFFSCSSGIMTEYNLANTKYFIYSTKLKNNSKVIMVANERFTFDTNQKGPNINLTNSSKTAVKQLNDGGYEIVLGTSTYYGGRHYWETKIEKSVEEYDVIIGVARRDIKTTTNNIFEEPVWGYECLASKKVGRYAGYAEISKDFGVYCKTTDIVGTLVQFNAAGKCSVSFYVNGKFVGKAFQNIDGPISPAFCLNASPNISLTITPGVYVPLDLANFSNIN